MRAGLPARLVAPEKRRASFGAKGRLAQLATWKWLAEAWRPRLRRRSTWAIDREGVAVGRVEGEVRAVEVDQDRAQAQRDALQGSGAGDRRRR